MPLAIPDWDPDSPRSLHEQAGVERIAALSSLLNQTTQQAGRKVRILLGNEAGVRAEDSVDFIVVERRQQGEAAGADAQRMAVADLEPVRN